MTSTNMTLIVARQRLWRELHRWRGDCLGLSGPRLPAYQLSDLSGMGLRGLRR